MAIIFATHTPIGMQAEANGNSKVQATINHTVSGNNLVGNREGKEGRFGPVG
ncbi:MAG: hypothetical protein ABSD97_00925 [Acidimicrobiales bacterium]|jgi:K+-transporting ATPase A subunit